MNARNSKYCAPLNGWNATRMSGLAFLALLALPASAVTVLNNSFEVDVIPALCSKELVSGLISHFLRWCDLGTPTTFSDHRFSNIEGGNKLGTLAGVRRSKNCIVHSCVPWLCVWAEDLNEYMVSIVSLGAQDDPELCSLIVIPVKWCSEPRKLAALAETFREMVLATPTETSFSCQETASGDYIVERTSNIPELLPKLTILKPSSINVILHYSPELDLPQLTVTSASF